MDPLAPNVVRRFMAAQFGYHGTKASLLPQISKRGLVAGSFSSFGDSYSEYDDGKHLFFTDSLEFVKSYGDTVLRFPWPSDTKPDMNKYGRILGHQFVSQRNVPAHSIEVERDNDWAPLVSRLPMYTGIFLDESSHNELVGWWKKHTNTPLHSKLWAHHMTIKFKPTAEEFEATPIGKKAHLKIIGWAADDKGQAVLVDPQGVESANKHPHITISTAPGTGPVYSNELLAKGSNRVSGPTLSGLVEARF